MVDYFERNKDVFGVMGNCVGFVNYFEVLGKNMVGFGYLDDVGFVDVCFFLLG